MLHCLDSRLHLAVAGQITTMGWSGPAPPPWIELEVCTKDAWQAQSGYLKGCSGADALVLPQS